VKVLWCERTEERVSNSITLSLFVPDRDSTGDGTVPVRVRSLWWWRRAVWTR
jgi:hypothetical protein